MLQIVLGILLIATAVIMNKVKNKNKKDAQNEEQESVVE